MSVKKEHGRHNKEVCDHLNLRSGDLKCNDWIITTAFYSSIHYIDHVLFPCNYDGKTFKNINEAHNYINTQSKHTTRGHLVTKLIPEYKGRYSFLVEESQNARYSNYNVNDSLARRAITELDKIAEYCEKHQSK